MPKLPDLTTSERPIPQAAGGIAQYRAGIEGIALERQGSELLAMAAREQEFIDKTANEVALNKVRQSQFELTDGEEGFLRVNGEPAVKPDFYKNYRDRFDKSIQDAVSGLTPAQQAKFKPMANMVRMQFNEGVLRHSAREGDVYANDTYEGIKATEAKAAQVFWQDPNAIALSRERVTAAVDSMASRFGWPKEKKDAQMQQAVGLIHAEVIDRAMANGAYEYAADWYHSHKTEMDPKIYEKIKEQRDQATFEDRAFDAAENALAITNNNFDEALKEVRKQPDAKVAKEAAAEIDRRQTRFMRAKNEAFKEYLGNGHLMIEQGVSRRNLKESKAYGKLDDAGKATLLDTWDAQQRERRAEAAGRDEQTTTQQWERWSDLVTMAARDPNAFKSIDVKSELFKIPKGQRDNLVNLYNKDKKDESGQKDTLSLNQQMGVVTKELKKSERGMFEGAVYSEILLEEKTAGRKLNQFERQKVIDRLTIERDVPWYKGGDKKTYEIAPAERGKYQPVPSKDDIAAIREKFKGRGIDNPSDEQIMGIYKTWKGIQ